MKTNLRVFAGAVILACGCAASSCNTSRPVEQSTAPQAACTAILAPGVFVEVRDSLTQAPLHSATLRILSDGVVIDSARSLGDIPGAGTSLAGVYERPGVYDVFVDRSGYATWRKDSIRVVGGECHVTTVRIVANLHAPR
jgi:hypothetical protein